MIILLDADGPLLDLTGETVRCTNLHKGTDHHPDQWTLWDAHFMDEKHRQWVKSALWAEPEFWENLPPTAGAAEGVRKLQAAGHEIHVVTSAFESCHGWESARRACLQKYFDIDKKFVTVTAQKHLVYGDVFIDDKVENVADWARRWGAHGTRARMYLFDMPHNRGPDAAGLARTDWPNMLEFG